MARGRPPGPILRRHCCRPRAWLSYIPEPRPPGRCRGCPSRLLCIRSFRRMPPHTSLLSHRHQAERCRCYGSRAPVLRRAPTPRERRALEMFASVPSAFSPAVSFSGELLPWLTAARADKQKGPTLALDGTPGGPLGTSFAALGGAQVVTRSSSSTHPPSRLGASTKQTSWSQAGSARAWSSHGGRRIS